MKKIVAALMILLPILTACSATKQGCNSEEAKALVIEGIKQDITSRFHDRPAFSPAKLISQLTFAVSDITTDSTANSQPVSCSASVSMKLPDNIFSRLNQPPILHTLNSFADMSGLKIENGAMTSRISYQIRITEDTQKLMVSTERDTLIAKGLYISALIGVWPADQILY